MTPIENEPLQRLGVDYLQTLEQLSIYVFFYGASPPVAKSGSSTCSASGIFVVLFSVSVAIFLLVVPFRKPFISQQAPKLDRRRGLSNRATTAMFAATVINFLLSSLNTGNIVALFIVFIQKGLKIIPNNDYPIADRAELLNSALRIVNIIGLWASIFPVSIKLSLSDFISIHTWWRYGSAISSSFGGLGPSSQINSG